MSRKQWIAGTVAVAALWALLGTAAELDEGTPPVNAPSAGRIIIDGESLAEFSARMRAEIRCANLAPMMDEYASVRTEQDRAILGSFSNVSVSLRGWDQELWRLAPYGFRYTGVLGAYANRVDAYVQQVDLNQAKLQLFLQLHGERRRVCERHPGEPPRP